MISIILFLVLSTIIKNKAFRKFSESFYIFRTDCFRLTMESTSTASVDPKGITAKVNDLVENNEPVSETVASQDSVVLKVKDKSDDIQVKDENDAQDVAQFEPAVSTKYIFIYL